MLTSAFDPVALKDLAAGAIALPGVKGARASIQQGPQAAVAVDVVADSVPFAGSDDDDPQRCTFSSDAYDVDIPRAWITQRNQQLIGAGANSLKLRVNEVACRRKSAVQGALRATLVLQGCAFFFSGRASQWSARFGGRDWSLTLKEDFFALEKALKAAEHAVMSCALSCALSDEADLEAAVATIHHVCDLLTYATDTEVRLARIIVDDERADGPLVVRLFDRSVPGKPILPVVPLNIDYDGAVKLLLDNCLDRFAAIRDTYCLNSVMGLARLGRREKVVTVKALLAANALEVLRYNFGHNVLVPAGRAVASDDDLYWPTGTGHPRQGKKMSFLELLTQLATDLGMSTWEGPRFRDMRNAVVHTGEVPGTTLMEKYREAIDVLHYVDTAVLALLEWDKVGGRYLPCNQPQDPRPGHIGNNVKSFSR